MLVKKKRYSALESDRLIWQQYKDRFEVVEKEAAWLLTQQVRSVVIGIDLWADNGPYEEGKPRGLMTESMCGSREEERTSHYINDSHQVHSHRS